MPTQNPRKKEIGPRKKANPRQAEINERIAQAVATLRDTLASKADAAREQEGSEDSANRTLQWVTLVFVIVTAALIFIQDLILHSSDTTFKETLIASNRAWLAITDIKFTRPLDSGDGPEVTAFVNNVGKSPALDVRTGGTWTVMIAKKSDNPQAFAFPSSPLWEALDVQIRSQCLNVVPLDGGESIFPLVASERSTLAEPKPRPNLQNVINQSGEILIAPGCLTYRDFGEIRHTGYCRYAVHEAGNWTFSNCPIGNFAK